MYITLVACATWRLEFVHPCLKTLFTSEEHSYLQASNYLLCWAFVSLGYITYMYFS
jgi:hypothetical protein